jgi:hypothetical protein
VGGGDEAAPAGGKSRASQRLWTAWKAWREGVRETLCRHVSNAHKHPGVDPGGVCVWRGRSGCAPGGKAVFEFRAHIVRLEGRHWTSQGRTDGAWSLTRWCTRERWCANEILMAHPLALSASERRKAHSQYIHVVQRHRHVCAIGDMSQIPTMREQHERRRSVDTRALTTS